MTRSLKDSYRGQLVAVLAANLLLYYALVKGVSFSDFDLGTARSHVAAILPGGLAIVLCGLLNSQLTPLQKARIVFLKWRDPLPGCRAFSDYAAQDSRIDMKDVRAKWSPLPRGARQQNALWYRLYQQEKDTGAVEHLNRHWLFARDYASICVLVLLALGVLGTYQMPNLLSWSIFCGTVLTQFLFAKRSAVNYAVRFVQTVVAQAAARKS